MKYSPELIKSTWKTSDTYGHENYTETPKKPGVYAIIFLNRKTNKWRLVYIGSTINLAIRRKTHNIMRTFWVKACFYFMECEDYFETEKELIRRMKPILNKAYK